MASLRSLLVASVVVAARALSKDVPQVEDPVAAQLAQAQQGQQKPIVEWTGELEPFREGVPEQIAADKFAAMTFLEDSRLGLNAQAECSDEVDANGCHAAGCRCVGAAQRDRQRNVF